ncbi:flagellar basal body-associated FliL family protein [Campylobacter insulaenigrae]|uniref:flagellar basal body-associated FliL family protein n=1 Tax=Campylobacter insulaenigrae TaxID=260714 RepID=UPI002153A1BC|nr:flagellar basal body-associated FliL family protein [Campylobacter insulaenigrae]MCR6573521.1 flagellar basal body-associated FliL family protein [Campylobacter insulaenigrae]MCR6580026.1 flagellar basal body-associated FliL family protein [Campylobacter insulaenigrae]MCR6586074.1 flagellar basal body-associated FliL family protein [Campylobacter insulaenigrae]
MKIFILCIFAVLYSVADTISIENFRTDLYSKTGSNILKKIELDLEFEGNKLEENKIKDALNTIISSYFYEDLFTEVGKNNFKETLLKFSNKKYKTQIEYIYIIRVNSIKEFDMEELKKFLKDNLKLDEEASDFQELPLQQKNIRQDVNETKMNDINSSNDKNTSVNKEANVSKEAMDMILKTMEDAQKQMLLPHKNEELF